MSREGVAQFVGTSQKTFRCADSTSHVCGVTDALKMNKLQFMSTLMLLLGCCFRAAAVEVADTTHLHEVEVVGERPKNEVIPVQVLTGEELKKFSSLSVADAMRFFSGVQVKDYGGVGGIKTINIRSMGSNHAGIVYDGVELGNAQNGQIDLGQFSLDNIEEISLHNGQKSEILQPAKDFGSAGQVYMRTRRPLFAPGERFHLRAVARTGSFDMLNLGATADLRLCNSVNASLSAEYLTSSGKYKFRYKRVNPAGELAYDTTAVRRNGDINAVRLEMNVNGTSARGFWNAKVYNYTSERGVPGAIVNNVWRRGERLWDNNSFAQGSWQSTWGAYTLLCNLKYAFYRTHYVNNDDRQVKIDNLYRQKELYFSAANEYVFSKHWRVSAAYDVQWNDLRADMANFARPVRLTNLVSVAAAASYGRVKMQVSGLGTFIHDAVRGQRSPADKHVFTPAAYLSVNPLRSSSDLSVRAFVKQSYRMPTFNDLYYADMGNSKLNPEKVTQYNLGVLYSRQRHGQFVSAVRLSVDGYYNYVTNKIVAYPKGQQFRWTMLNLGKVDIQGIDFTGLITLSPLRDLDVTLRAQYTYQRAIDITNPADSYYRHQIPYIPHHSGAAVLNVAWRRWNLNYSFIYVGERYNQQENIKYNYTQPWYTSDVTLSRDISLRDLKLRAQIEINNILNQYYDVIVNYPMPGCNWRLTLTVEI